MIFGPDGSPLCDPLDAGVEAVLKADIDLRDIDYAKTVWKPIFVVSQMLMPVPVH
jgi:hypothetical protein